MAIFELSLVAFHNSGYWRNSGLPWSSRSALIIATCIAWVCLAWCWDWSVRASHALNSKARSPWASLSLAALTVVVFLPAYIGSVALFCRTGAFANGETLRFAFINARMLILYFLQVEAFGPFVLLLVVVVALVVLLVVRRRIQLQIEGRARQTTRFVTGAIMVWLTGDIVFLLGALEPKGEFLPTTEWWKSRPPLALELQYHTSPMISLISSFLVPQQVALDGGVAKEDLGPLRVELERDERGTRPVIIIAVESLRHDVIGAMHQGQDVMPNVNRLAREGRWFTRAYSQSTHSDYADPCLVSSLYPLRSPQHHYYSSTDPWPKALIYDVLKGAGYNTAIFSSQNEAWGNMAEFLDSPNLDVFFDSRVHRGDTHASDQDPGFSRFVRQARAAGKLDDAVTVRQACDWIRNRAGSGQPFCIYMNLQSPHFPYQFPARTAPFRPCDIDFDASFVRYPPEKVEIVRNRYFNALRYVDDQLGVLMRTLQETGIRNNTLVVLAGDNGEAFYENGHPTHAGLPYESAIHVALVFHCPELLEAMKEADLAQAIDICPTILGLLNLSPHPGFQGIDLFASQRIPSGHRLAFVHVESALSSSEAVVCGDFWKVISDRRSNECRLYRIDVDPSEQNNVIEREPDVARILLAVVQRWRRQQLLYYCSQKYYGFYLPPRTPVITESEAAILAEARDRSTSDRRLHSK